IFTYGSKLFQSLLSYEIDTSISYLSAREGIHLSLIRIVTHADDLRRTLDGIINYGYIPEDTLIIWVSRWGSNIRQRINMSDIDIYYDCSKYVVFMKV
ncbi:MAG: hypothetical protein QXF82_05835, partial [Nitrososphaeria archaeon]